ncbi:hypothetical protein BBJ28_00015564 [Nothophytophthora sp. Chile5]|nr:hypothetical protein BBJ28_00015564 [Nothophytophthora sp. Chile5]
MSTAGDIDAFEHSVEPSVHETLFNSKKWTYIQDSTSNNGAYSGQIQLNLSSISSQASFVNWQEAVIQLPIKMEITNTGATSLTTTAAATVDQLIPKNGSWNWIDSVSVVIDGTTVQSNQIHQNVAATFSALTEWTLQDEKKLGTTSNFSLDSYEAPQTDCPQSLDNLPTVNFMSSTVGEYGLANTYTNGGARERSLFTGVKTAANSLAFDIGGSVANAITVAKPVVYTPAVGAFAVGASMYTAHYIATVRLADICDYFKKCPASKNVKGFIYLNYNSSATSITTNASGPIAPPIIASMATNMLYGNTCPVLYNLVSGASNVTIDPAGAFSAASGLAFNAAGTITIRAGVDGTTTAGTGIGPSQPFTRLLVPTYAPNPSADHALVQKKTFKYFERMTNKFTVQAGAPFTYTLTNGIANPRKIFLQPVITNMTAGSAQYPDAINPFRSPFSTVPCTTSPFVAIKNLQLTVGNVPIWNNLVNFGYDMYVQEMMRSSGIDGGLDDSNKAGLLSQRQWESLYRFIPVDIGHNLDLKRDADQYVNSYQKKQRGQKFKDNRMSKEEKDIAKQRLYEEMIRAREAEADDDTSSDTDSVKREIAHEKKLKESNAHFRSEYTNTIDDFTRLSRSALYKMIKGRYKADVDARMGEGYFNDNFKQPKGNATRARMIDYKANLKGILDGIFI